MPLCHDFKTGLERPRHQGQRPVILMLRLADRHIATNLFENFLQRLFAKRIGTDRQPAGHHAATDIDADCGGNDSLPGGDHRTNGRANTEMNIWHRGHMVVDERQAGDVDELLA